MGQIHKTETSLDDLFSQFAIDPEEETLFPDPDEKFFIDEDEKEALLAKNNKKNRNVE